MPYIIGIILLAVILAAGYYVGSRALLEPQRPEFSFYTLPEAENERGKAKIRVVFFSDYHHPLNHLPLETLFQFVRETKPDALLFGGDMASKPKDLEGGQKIAERIAAFCRDIGIPYAAIRGNHDDFLTGAAAYPLLINQSMLLRGQDGSRWQLAGLEDIRLGTPDLEKALSTVHPASAGKTDNIPKSRWIILAHNPDTVLTLPRGAAAYCFSGHFHGGQIKLPFKIEYSVLRDEALCRSGISDGAYKIRGLWHFISRGWGEVLFPCRLGARPEITLLELYEPLAQPDSSENDARIQSYLAKKPLHYPYALRD